MRKWLLLTAVLFAGAAGFALDFTVGEKGDAAITSDGKPLLSGELLQLMNEKWGTVSSPLAAPPEIVREGGKVVCNWATDMSTVSRSIEKLPGGGVRLEWKIKFLNGIPEGRNIELTYFVPAAAVAAQEGPNPVLASSASGFDVPLAGGKTLVFEFSGTRTPWQFQDMRKAEWHKNYRLILHWLYNPEFVNEVNSAVTITEK